MKEAIEIRKQFCYLVSCFELQKTARQLKKKNKESKIEWLFRKW